MWFSARLLDEIAGARTADTMLKLAMGAAVCTAVLTLLRLYGSSRWETCTGRLWQFDQWN